MGTNLRQRKAKDLKLETIVPTKDGLIVFERFGFKNVKITKAVSTDQEAVEEFP